MEQNINIYWFKHNEPSQALSTYNYKWWRKQELNSYIGLCPEVGRLPETGRFTESILSSCWCSLSESELPKESLSKNSSPLSPVGSSPVIFTCPSVRSPLRAFSFPLLGRVLPGVNRQDFADKRRSRSTPERARRTCNRALDNMRLRTRSTMSGSIALAFGNDGGGTRRFSSGFRS